MRLISSPYACRVAGVFLVASLSTLGAPGVRAQDASTAERAELLERAREAQREFERYRASRIPVDRERSPGVCDERIGRMCIWFGGEGELRFPAERPEVMAARDELVRLLHSTNQRVKDFWVLGQLVHYLVEERNFGEAERMATACGIEETWWCGALLAYSLHVRAEYVLAESAFREALSSMPPAERERWTSLHYLLTRDGEGYFDELPPAERQRRRELFWRLSDPLFLFNGNDRLTDHWARLVEVTNFRDAERPQDIDWGEDLAETIIRYGRNIGFSRVMNPAETFRTMRDTRRVIGHHHPKSRGYLFPEAFVESPSDIPPESWITAPREARTWYAPPYAPDVRALDTQVGRFRRGDRMLVVGAYEPRPVEPVSDGRAARGARAPGGSAAPTDAPIRGAVHSAFLLIPMDGSQAPSTQGDEVEGVLTIQAPPGRYVSGLEVVDVEGRRAWRARQGVVQLPLEPGGLDVSDLLILKEGSPLPPTLEESIPYVRPHVRLRLGERFPVIWEAYGLGVDEPVRVTIGFTRGRPDFLARVGEFLGVIEPDRPVEVRFEDTGPATVQTAFRALELELPDIEPGEYTIHLRLETAGREPVVTSRPVFVAK